MSLPPPSALYLDIFCCLASGNRIASLVGRWAPRKAWPSRAKEREMADRGCNKPFQAMQRLRSVTFSMFHRQAHYTYSKLCNDPLDARARSFRASCQAMTHTPQPNPAQPLCPAYHRNLQPATTSTYHKADCAFLFGLFVPHPLGSVF